MLRPNEGRLRVHHVERAQRHALHWRHQRSREKRAWEHRNGMVAGFTQARLRELQMKKWKRQWKLSEVEQMNPDWRDLYPTLFEGS
jgi:predicted GIY-YIG superfamily endonuclease